MKQPDCGSSPREATLGITLCKARGMVHAALTRLVLCAMHAVGEVPSVVL